MGESEVATREAKLKARLKELELKQREAEEWEDVAVSTKRQSDDAAKVAASRLSDMQDEIATLESTKNALQKEMQTKADIYARSRQELEEEMDAQKKELESELEAKQNEAEEWEEVAISTKRQGEDFARQAAARIADLESEIEAKQKEAEEWEEVAISTKHQGEEFARQAAARTTDLENEIATLEMTKQSLQREAALTNEMVVRMKAETEEVIAKLRAEIDAKRKEADEWEEVALKTKREWEAQTKLWSVTHSELQAQNQTLEQTKRALTHEHQVKTEIHTATKAELEQKLAALMETLTTTQKRAAEDIKVLEEKKAKLE